jgi:hypothetical protein
MRRILARETEGAEGTETEVAEGTEFNTEERRNGGRTETFYLRKLLPLAQS